MNMTNFWPLQIIQFLPWGNENQEVESGKIESVQVQIGSFRRKLRNIGLSFVQESLNQWFIHLGCSIYM